MNYLSSPGGDAAQFSTVYQQHEGWRNLTHTLSVQVATKAGKPSLTENIEHLVDHVLFKEASYGLADPTHTPPQQLLSHLVTNLMSEVVKIDKDGEHSQAALFEALAEKLLTRAFPNKAADPNLPLAARWVLGGGMTSKLLGVIVWSDLSKYSWDQLVKDFGKVCEENFAVVRTLQQRDAAVKQTLDENPGATTLASSLSDVVMNGLAHQSVDTSALSLLGAKEANLLNQALSQVLSGQGVLAEDQPVLEETKSWMKGLLTGGIEVILSNLLRKREEDKTPDERRMHIVEALFGKMRERSNGWHVQRKQYELMHDRELVTELLRREGTESLVAAFDMRLDPATWADQARQLIVELDGDIPTYGNDQLPKRLLDLRAKVDSAEDKQRLDQLMRQHPDDWSQRAREYLIGKLYADAAQELLEGKVDFRDFEKYFPRLFPLKDVLPHLHAFLGGLLREYHIQATEIQAISGSAKQQIERADPELLAFVDSKIVASVQESVVDLGNETVEKLNQDLPEFLDSLVKGVLKSPVASIRDMRNDLIQQAIYIVAGEAVRVKDGQQPGQRLQALLQDLAPELAKAFQAIESAASSEEIPANLFEADFSQRPLAAAAEPFARLLLDRLVPDEVWNRVLNEQMRQLITKDTIASVIAEYIVEYKTSADNLQARAAKGKELLEGLATDKEHGDFVALIRESIESAVAATHEMSKEEGKISPKQPDLINDLIKGALASNDRTLKNGIDWGIGYAIYAVVGDLLQRDPAKSPTENLMTAVRALVATSADPDDKPGVRWLNALVSDDLWNDIVPEVMRKSITREKVSEWVLESYVPQLQAIGTLLSDQAASKDEEILRAQKFIHRQLAEYDAPEGLAGYGGLVKELESILLAGDPAADVLINGLVANIVGNLKSENRSFMQPGALIRALRISLPALSQTEGEVPTEEQLAEQILRGIFPAGPSVEAVPLIAADGRAQPSKAVWNEVLSTLTVQLKRVTTSAGRQETALQFLNSNKCIPDPTASKERQFKVGLSNFVKLQTRAAVDGLFGPTPNFATRIVRFLFRGIATIIAGFVTLMLRGRIWKFLSNETTDPKAKRVISTVVESLMSQGAFAAEDYKKSAKDLETSVERMLSSNDIARWPLGPIIARFAASSLAGNYGNASILDVLAPKEAAKAEAPKALEESSEDTESIASSDGDSGSRSESDDPIE